MHEVNDGDGLVVEVVPEGVGLERVVDEHIFRSEHGYSHSLHE